MTLEEAIKHCEEVAKELEEEAVKGCCDDSETMDKCIECADEHRQLAEWLRELKKYRAIFEKVGKILADNGYTIDDLDTIFAKTEGDKNVNEKQDSLRAACKAWEKKMDRLIREGVRTNDEYKSK